MEYKYTLHCPVEQYGFIQVDDIPTQEEAIEEYQSVMRNFVGGAGLPSKEFNEIYDTYRKTQKMENGGDFYDNLSRDQKLAINELKKSFNRD